MHYVGGGIDHIDMCVHVVNVYACVLCVVEMVCTLMCMSLLIDVVCMYVCLWFDIVVWLMRCMMVGMIVLVLMCGVRVLLYVHD